jgi:ribonuclease Y
MSNRNNHLENRIREQETLVARSKEQLEKISGMTAEEAKKMLVTAMEEEARFESMKMIKKIEEEARERAYKKSKEIIAVAIQRYAGEYVG